MINFLKYKWLYATISAVIILSGIFSMVRWGFKYSIDFVGGTNLEYQTVKQLPLSAVKNIFRKDKIDIVSISEKGADLAIRTAALDNKQQIAIINELQKQFNTKITIIQSETVGPVLGRETMIKTLVASLIAIVGILLYMSFAFRSFNFAISAILAMFHDFLVVVGCYSLMSRFFGAEVDTMFVTAILTSMSFSVHDTIVIFDKIREYKKEQGIRDMTAGANKALTETLVRSLNNSMTIIFMLLALTLLGGVTIRFFVATLLVGTITGTYSSPFVATPILVWMEKRRK